VTGTSSIDKVHMLKKILKEATRIEQWQQEIYTALHNINAEWITSGRLNISRLPTSSEANRFLVVRTANADPVYDLIVADDIPGLDASKIVSGTFDVARIPNLDASKITSGTFDVARIPNLDASKITSGTFDVARIPDLDASKITSGRFPLSRLPTSSTANRFLVVRTANADPVYDAIAAADIPGLDASKIVSGRFSVSRLPDGTSGYVLVGQGIGYDMAWRDISGIAGTITDSQHGTKTSIPFAHHGDWGHYGKIPTLAPTGAAERAYVDSANLYVHDGTSWVLRATRDWNNLINKPSTFPPSAHASTHEKGGADEVKALGSITLDDVTLASLTADPTLAAGKMFFRSDLGSLRYSPDGTSVKGLDTERVSASVSRLSETYTAGEEKTQFSLSGHGFAAIVHMGDGNSEVTTRLYIDGSLFDSCPANVFAIFHVTFTSSLSIRGYAASAGTYYRSTSYINGFRRVA